MAPDGEVFEGLSTRQQVAGLVFRTARQVRVEEVIQMRALILAAAALALSVFSFVAVGAQSFDGVYKGTRMTTRIAPYDTGARLECTPVGRRNGIEFRVTGSSITMRYLDFGHVVSGTVTPDGSFQLAALYAQHGGPTAAKVSGTWTGRIVGSRLSGKLLARAATGECHGEFSAQK